ncbi:hypothetical protein BDV97DRAFT_65411 [Delphinella strobiligena]|nr:hypothetical protein BDV97DRAFT_65411 [Delphinella strobiligena]
MWNLSCRAFVQPRIHKMSTRPAYLQDSILASGYQINQSSQPEIYPHNQKTRSRNQRMFYCPYKRCQIPYSYKRHLVKHLEYDHEWCDSQLRKVWLLSQRRR